MGVQAELLGLELVQVVADNQVPMLVIKKLAQLLCEK